MRLFVANAAASASAQGDNATTTEITGDGSNLVRDVSWRQVPCATMYNSSGPWFCLRQQYQANYTYLQVLPSSMGHVAVQNQVWLGLCLICR
jgi:hypothetical protein